MLKNKLKETGDMGDRMMTGISYNTGGTSGGSLGTFASPNVSQNPSNFYQSGEHKVDAYVNRKADVVDDNEIEAIKYKVTPDEIIQGISQELKNMFHKNKSEAKRIVVQNLKKDPKYYSSLHMLNIQGESPTDTKNKSPEITAIDEIIKDMYKKRVATQNSSIKEIQDALQDTYERKRKKSRND